MGHQPRGHHHGSLRGPGVARLHEEGVQPRELEILVRRTGA